MNTETGQIHRGPEEIGAAQLRGEPLVPVSERVARVVETGMRAMNRAEQRKAERRNRKRGPGYTSK